LHQFGAQLAELIDGMVDAEDRLVFHRARVLTRVMCAPSSDLPQKAHFRERAAQCYAECEARGLSRLRVWHADDYLQKRGH
jgi:hypothetical protein